MLARGEPVALGARAFDLLLALIEHRDRVVGKDELLAKVWPGVVVEDNNLTVQISTLRKVLGASAIATVAGHGYRFTLPLTDDGAAPAARPEGRSSGERPVIAVLAFDNLSDDPQMQFFSDGVSEEIIQRLARGTGLRVISRTTSFQFRGERKAEAAQRLKCAYVLDGSIRRAADHVRISAHMMEAATGTTLWSERYDRALEGMLEVQDEIAESIAHALDHRFCGVASRAVEPAVYDLYLRSSPRSYAPDELRTGVGVLEVVTQRAPHFIEAWGRLAYLRAFLHMYLPFAERAASAANVAREASCALARDPQNNDALVARCFVAPPFGQFVEAEDFLQRLRRAPGSGDGRRYISWLLRLTGRLRASLDEAEGGYRLDALDPMSANLVALARMATGHVAEAVPVYEDLVARIPNMSFPISSLLRAHAFLQDWPAVDRLLALAATRPLREFQDTIPFVRAKRDPTPENIDAYRSGFQAHVAITGCVDVARLVYAAHLGLVDAAYRATEGARLGPAGASADLMGPDGYRTALLFQASMPELRNDPRFPRLCARLGLVEFWLATGQWPDCVDEVPYDFRRACEQLRGAAKDAFGF
ncbi:MAG: winged helix-turn-helix domain-containing protein [Rubrivivax sp.]